MNKSTDIDFKAINNAALSKCPALLETLLPGGKLQGHEYTCANLEGGEGSSTSININSGAWADFSTEERGGDIISLVAAIKNVNQVEAAKRLADMVGYYLPANSNTFQNTTQETGKKNKPTPIMPVPENAISIVPDMRHFRHGKPTEFYTYKNESGQLLGYVCRFTLKELDAKGKNKKEFTPIIYTKSGWRWQGFQAPYPFYGLENLIGLPTDAPILILEGEHKADVAKSVLASTMAVLGLHGGCGKAAKMDLSPLKGKAVYYWPDNDAPGFKAALIFAEKVKSISASIHIIKPPSEAKETWDIADAIEIDGWDYSRLKEWISVNRLDPEEFSRLSKERWGTEEKKTKTIDTGTQYTEDDLACIFEQKYKDTLRYDHDRGKWYGWNGKYWELDKLKRGLYLAREVCRNAAKTANQKQIFYLKKANTIKAVECLAQSETTLGVTHDIWDADDFLLGTPNGIVDLKTGKLLPPDKNHYITKITSVAPCDNADTPLWAKFLNETTNEDAELQKFLRQMAGMCLTGSTKEQVMFFVYGDGGNGKSVFLNVLNEILNDYAKITPIETFTASKTDRHPTEMAALHGARLVSSNETEEGRAWAESRLKQFTGGDTVSARFMRQDLFEFKPKAKLVIIGNHKPALRNVDEAMRRRINIIPFTNKPKEVDRELGEKLKREYPAILRWMIDGCLDWLRNGLQRPDCVKIATDDYFESQDIFGQWLEDCCNLNPMFFGTVSSLFNSWKEFAENSGLFPGSSKSFAGEMQKRGFERERDNRARRGYRGICLKTIEKEEENSRQDWN